MQIKVIITAVLVSFFLGACSQKQTSDESDREKATTKSSASEISQSQRIINAYLEVKDALVQTNGQSASTAAMNLVEVLDNESDLFTKIKFDAKHIAETQDVGHQRDHFNTLSDNIYALVISTSANENTIYRQYCPMAFDNKGAYWLSAEKEVNNPYFGDMMLHCGMVKEKL